MEKNKEKSMVSVRHFLDKLICGEDYIIQRLFYEHRFV